MAKVIIDDEIKCTEGQISPDILFHMKSIDTAKYYVENHKADYNYVNDDGENVLFYCYDNLELLEYYLKLGVNANQKNKEGDNVLFAKVNISRGEKIAAILVKYGFDINQCDKEGRHILWTFVSDDYYNGRHEIDSYIKLGADINYKDGLILHQTVKIWSLADLMTKGAKINDKHPLTFDEESHYEYAACFCFVGRPDFCDFCFDIITDCYRDFLILVGGDPGDNYEESKKGLMRIIKRLGDFGSYNYKGRFEKIKLLTEEKNERFKRRVSKR